MNFLDYEKALAADPDFDAKHTFMLPIEQIEYTQHEEGNEVRLTKESSHAQLRHELKAAGGNHTPVSVHGGPEHFGLDDGSNRVRELTALGISNVKCVMSNYKSASERRWGMLLDNILPAHTPASSADIVGVLVKDIKEDFALGTEFETITKEKVLNLLRKNLGKKSLHSNTENSIVKKVITELPSGVKKYTNYANKADAAAVFSRINQWGMAIKNSGDVCEDSNGQPWAVYFAGSDSWVRQNGIFASFWKKPFPKEGAVEEHRAIKVLLAVYDEKIYNSKGDLKTFRQRLHGIALAVNDKMQAWGATKKLYDRFVVLPQVLKGAHPEDHDKLVAEFTHDL